MAVKKSQLYSALWEGCNALRASGGMDYAQFKDYVLTMLFIKYVSDKYAGQDGLITIPEGATFEDMVALKGQKDIGDKINKQIIRPIFRENGLEGSVELVDFNDDDKLGSDKEKVDLLDGLIRIFENPSLNFKNNRAEDDDILGDAYEFLMRHFASESGKSKGNFYTPAEVSRVLAKIIEIEKAETSDFSVYDPTCGSASLLLKVAMEADRHLSLYGQEKENSVKSLAVMNMWMHGYEDAIIKKGNTIARPDHKEKDGSLKRFDRVVANPPFSVKNWSQGITPLDDEFKRFIHYGVPPDKNGDYAFLLHIIASLKGTGKAAVILPHGVLFRGNAEADIRQNLIERKYIKGIIGLPPNMFYGTGIPACIIVIDKENTDTRKGIFMIDASKGYLKDGNKNRLREQDIHKIVDVFNAERKVDKYARFVPFEEIIGNEYNLNLPRYIDTQEDEDIQDLDAHINGGIPSRDVEGMNTYWEVYPSLRNELFEETRPGYNTLKTDSLAIKEAIFSHQEFKAYRTEMDKLFASWKAENTPTLKGIHEDTSPKKLIHEIAENLLNEYTGKALVDRYDMYQHLMDYWLDIMKDDNYMIIEDGWVAKLHIVKQTKKETIYDCDLVPKYLVVNRYFPEDLRAIQAQEADKESKENDFTTLLEDNTGEEAIFEEIENGKISKADLNEKLEEYQDLAFAAHFNAPYLDYQSSVEALEQCIADIREMLEGDLWGTFFEKLTNAKGKLVKGNIQDRVLDLKKQIELSDLPPQYKAKAEAISKTFEKTDWETGVQHAWFEELDVHYRYLSLLSNQTSLRKEVKQHREALLKKLKGIMATAGDYIAEIKTIEKLIALQEEISQLATKIKEAYKALEEKTIRKYGELTEEEVQTLVVDDKWMTTLSTNIQAEIDEISQRLTGRIKELAERYESTLGALGESVTDYETKVNNHLLNMGVEWN
ncbi:MAG: type I restriction-modification system subunit M [Cyclobacteriaceae bacterium]